MDIETVKYKMREQICDAIKIAQAMQWVFILDEDKFILLVEMRHRRKPENAYLLKVTYDDYPQRALSYYFANRGNHESGSPPPNVHHGHPQPGICTPGTRECCEIYHVNDSQWQWDPNKYPLRRVLMEIQNLLEKGIGG